MEVVTTVGCRRLVSLGHGISPMECKACSVLTGPGSRLASMTEGFVSVRKCPAEPKTELLCADKAGKQRRPFSAQQFRFFFFF